MTGKPLQDNYPSNEPLSLWQCGNKKAFGQLYDKYSPALFGVINEIVGNTKNAEIILQKTFREIWNKRMSIDCCNQRPFFFMFKIARALAIASIRGKSARPDVINRYANSLVCNPDSINVNEIQNMAFKIIYYTGCTFDEAGDRLNIAGDVLKILMVTTIEQLKEQA